MFLLIESRFGTTWAISPRLRPLHLFIIHLGIHLEKPKENLNNSFRGNRPGACMTRFSLALREFNQLQTQHKAQDL